MLHCPACDSDYADGLAACPDCDPDDQEVVRCERCSREYVGGAGCPACGALREPRPCAIHGDRQGKGQCVVCGLVLCRQCAEPVQRAYLCADHRSIRVTEGWAEVYTTTGEVEAQFLRDALRAEGMDAQVLSQRDLMLSFDLGDLSIVRVLVPVWSYYDAREALRAHLGGQPDGSVCAACGADLAPEEESCRACGGRRAG